MPRNYGQCEKATFGVQCTCESLTASKRKQWSAFLCECASVPWRSHLLIGRCKSLKKRRHHNRTVTEKVPMPHMLYALTHKVVLNRGARGGNRWHNSSSRPPLLHLAMLPIYPHTLPESTHTHTHIH